MDGHDYFDRSCNVNVDSIEVFFDATDPMLIAYVDALLAFESAQEVTPRQRVRGLHLHALHRPDPRSDRPATVSAVVLRRGLRPARRERGHELIDFAIMLALNSNFKGILHWGQRNESTRAHVQERFGDTSQSGISHRGGKTLSQITQNGKLDGFSNAFTRRTGLEVVTPIIGILRRPAVLSQPITIHWDCDQNPPATVVSLQVISPSGVQSSFAALPLVGQQQVTATEQGVYTIWLVAGVELAGERRETSEQVSVTVGMKDPVRGA